jgi:hypothetical protein
MSGEGEKTAQDQAPLRTQSEDAEKGEGIEDRT